MKRVAMILIFSVLSSVSFAADDGGFGSAFSNKPPSALAEAPGSEIAQFVRPPSVPSDASELQDIMPAAGDGNPETSHSVPSERPDEVSAPAPAKE